MQISKSNEQFSKKAPSAPLYNKFVETSIIDNFFGQIAFFEKSVNKYAREGQNTVYIGLFAAPKSPPKILCLENFWAPPGALAPLMEKFLRSIPGLDLG